MSALEDEDIAYLHQYVEEAMEERRTFPGHVRLGDLATQAMLRALVTLYERVELLESHQRDDQVHRP